MKKITLALLAVATIALGACSGNKVSAEKFAEEAKKVEEEHYTEAPVKYELKENMILYSTEGEGEIKYTRLKVLFFETGVKHSRYHSNYSSHCPSGPDSPYALTQQSRETLTRGRSRFRLGSDGFLISVSDSHQPSDLCKRHGSGPSSSQPFIQFSAL